MVSEIFQTDLLQKLFSNKQIFQQAVAASPALSEQMALDPKFMEFCENNTDRILARFQPHMFGSHRVDTMNRIIER